VIAWRLCRRPYAAFDGEGARLYGGRWTPPGLPVVYTAASAALAMAEYLVHLEPREAPRDLVLVAADVPASLTMASVKAGDLPSRWRRYPAPEALARIGARWAEEGKAAILCIPSAVVPQELNYLLNPRHPDFRKISLRRPEPFSFDPRLRR
jgi:RES domain-containing protein